MTIGIAGLGLIGGSLAKAFSENSDATVFGYNIDESIMSFAQLAGAIDGALDLSTIPKCDLLLIAVNPKAATRYLESIAEYIAPETIVLDCCGVKQRVCESCFAIAKAHGFTFVGAHPMAGTHNSGFKHSKANLFRGASMVLVPPVYDDMSLLGRVEELLKPVGFGKLTVTTGERHDEIIAFSSQLAHVVSNAYVKSPTAQAHKGLSAGSYKDLTRVARLNPDMWAELFMENRDALLFEVDTLIASLGEYRDAIAAEDLPRLRALLDDGSRIKTELDGR